jgi:cell division transport system permease protein
MTEPRQAQTAHRVSGSIYRRLPSLLIAALLHRIGNPRRKKTSILPARNVSANALIAVIAIMTFLSCLTLGAVNLVSAAANAWQSQISREATVQIRPRDGLDMDAALNEARNIVLGFDGIEDARIVDKEATARLLEPWLGSGLDIDELPVPRLIVITIDEKSPPDFEAMRDVLTSQIRNASLDDHRSWVDRLVAMSRATVSIGIVILGLMLGATVMTVIFATRGAMASSRHVVDVLHFVGAEASFIATEYRSHFLKVALKGAASGGLAAICVFYVSGWWTKHNIATPGGDQAAALFGNFALGLTGYAMMAMIVILVTLLTAVTTHFTVISRLSRIEDSGIDAE